MFKDILAFLKSTDNTGKKKKVSPFVIVLCAIIIIVPTSLALLYAYSNNDSDTVTNVVVKATLYDANGAELASEEIIESNLDTSSVVKIFHSMVANKTSVSTPSELSEHNFKLDFSRGESSEQFLCFFTDSYKTSYLKDSNDTYFTIDEADYDLFLNSSFSQPVYPQAIPPMLITGDSEEIRPTEAEWYYIRQDKQSILSSPVLAESADTTYNISGAINLHFLDLPDSCTAQILDEKGIVIYDGSLEELAFVKPQTDTLLKARVSATWDSKDGRSSYGKATYVFNVILGNKAEFSINKTAVTAGDFIIISVKNAQSTSKVLYSAINPITDKTDEESAKQLDVLYSYKPVFITDGDSARAIIPFHQKLPESTFSFTVAYGAAEKDFTVEIKERQTKEVVLPKVSFEISPLLSQSSIESFDSLIKNIKPSSQNIRFFRGEFASPTDFGFDGGYSFDDLLRSSDKVLEINAVGAEFLAPSADSISVKASNVGVVLEASYSQFIGNYVVIDHGMGLRTWYCGLSDFNVKAGDIVAKGELIGKSGESPTVSGNGFVLMCSVYDTLISPDTLWLSDFEFEPEELS